MKCVYFYYQMCGPFMQKLPISHPQLRHFRLKPRRYTIEHPCLNAPCCQTGAGQEKMVLPGLLLLELTLYASCFICGIVTAASTTIVQGNFGGHCMLYGLVNYNTTASLIGVQSSSTPSLCYFVSAISVLVAVT
ncbi:transmembrane protein 179B, partial [Notothenia coriiceps]|uniref:Transmembrane protein 179B n=1 Tax=Notothenia coriiceps TaxID=8208 RepID=A0A6I9NCJ4_9TELE